MRRLHHAAPAERGRVTRSLVAALEAELLLSRNDERLADLIADHRCRFSHARRRPASSDADGSSSAW